MLVPDQHTDQDQKRKQRREAEPRLARQPEQPFRFRVRALVNVVVAIRAMFVTAIGVALVG
jgi:hypothetical protein